jgi:tripartite-type tricarboxylate transporter receptor subunit TctC
MASEIVGRLDAEIGSILSLPEVKKRMEDIAVETASSSPAELAAMTRADADKWGRRSSSSGSLRNDPMRSCRRCGSPQFSPRNF